MTRVMLFFVLFLSINAFSQSGVYFIDKAEGAIKWTLNLNDDGTFLYHFHRDLSEFSEANKPEDFYGRGTWVLQGKVIILSSKPSDFNEKFTVNLNNSKARYITKSPRDMSGKIVKTALRFYESETFHIKGLELIKVKKS